MIELARGIPPLDDHFKALIHKYIIGSGESELTVKDVYERMVNTDPHRIRVWWIVKPFARLGYLCAEIMCDEYGQDVVLVQSTYVDPTMQENFWPEMVDRLKMFGESSGCKEMYFTTRRNPKAFARLLRTKWTLDSYVMKHEF